MKASNSDFSKQTGTRLVFVGLCRPRVNSWRSSWQETISFRTCIKSPGSCSSWIWPTSQSTQSRTSASMSHCSNPSHHWFSSPTTNHCRSSKKPSSFATRTDSHAESRLSSLTRGCSRCCRQAMTETKAMVKGRKWRQEWKQSSSLGFRPRPRSTISMSWLWSLKGRSSLSLLWLSERELWSISQMFWISVTAQSSTIPKNR